MKFNATVTLLDTPEKEAAEKEAAHKETEKAKALLQEAISLLTKSNPSLLSEAEDFLAKVEA